MFDRFLFSSGDGCSCFGRPRRSRSLGVLAQTLLALFAVTISAPASAAPWALVGGRAHLGNGKTVSPATVVIDGDRIVSVGTAPPAAGMPVVNVGGALITPGLVAANSALGLEEISLEPSTVDAAPSEASAKPLRPAFSAADGYHAGSSLIRVARLGGITSALSTPVGGLVSGTSAWVDLVDSALDKPLVRRHTALIVNLDPGGEARPQPSALSQLREALEGARVFAASEAAYDAGRTRPLGLSVLALRRLSEALKGDLPVHVRVGRSSDILRTLELAREYGLKLVLTGAEEAWQVASQIAADQVPVLLRPQMNLPEQFATLGSRIDNAAILRRAKVRVVLMTAGAHNIAGLRQEAGNAVAAGLPWEEALSAVTSVPAGVFGVDADYGTLEAGKLANIVVWNGDPFEVSSWATHVFIRGQQMPQRSRQTELYQRYRVVPLPSL